MMKSCSTGFGLFDPFFGHFWPFLTPPREPPFLAFLAFFGNFSAPWTVRHLPGRDYPRFGGGPPCLGGDPPSFGEMGTCRDVVNPVLVVSGYPQSLNTLFERPPPG